MRVSFSNTGECADIFAPGEGVNMACWESDTCTGKNGGTSFANPMVGGAAALILGRHPTATVSTVRETILTQALSDVVGGDLLENTPNKLLYVENLLTGSYTLATPAPTEFTAYEFQHAGLCVHGSSHANCHCHDSSSSTTLEECKSKCDDLSNCTGIAHHTGGNCKIYTVDISSRWSSDRYLKFQCYKKGEGAPATADDADEDDEGDYEIEEDDLLQDP
jgi:hypothetical protein